MNDYHKMWQQAEARVAALEEALRRIRDYATPGYRNNASMELALDGIYKAADDSLEAVE